MEIGATDLAGFKKSPTRKETSARYDNEIYLINEAIALLNELDDLQADDAHEF